MKSSLSQKNTTARQVRIRWQFDTDTERSGGAPPLAPPPETESDLADIDRLIVGNSFATFFQPIYDMGKGYVFGYESLSRIVGESRFADIGDLFRRAIRAGRISALDCACFRNTLRGIKELGLCSANVHLFLNICPETLMGTEHHFESCDRLVEELEIPKDRIVLEITEESMISNYGFFTRSLDNYRKKGYKIAIDDFGAGYGGLKMLSTIEPDFVKIDRHFISNIDRAIIKFNLVDAITVACNRIGISVVAEGVEREEEMRAVRNTGIELLQGYYLGMPSPLVDPGRDCAPPFLERERQNGVLNGEPAFIGDIALEVAPIGPSEPVMNAFSRFMENPDLRGLPVAEKRKVVGMLNRSRFLETHILGRRGYGFLLNTYKAVADIMERNIFLCESDTTFEEIVKRIHSRKENLQHDDICVTRNGKYLGTVAITLLLNAITERNIILARGSNPLTGLPGNEFISREISSRLARNMHFDVAYIDIDNFKPYNDHYGFSRGDSVIRALAEVITGVLSLCNSTTREEAFNFAGHIGGDDFIVLTRPQLSGETAEKIIAGFESRLSGFHGDDDFAAGCYTARNRKGEEEKTGLLSLSIGIVSTEVSKISSFAQLASVATDVKKKAKMRQGSSIARDRRMMG